MRLQENIERILKDNGLNLNYLRSNNYFMLSITKPESIDIEDVHRSETIKDAERRICNILRVPYIRCIKFISDDSFYWIGFDMRDLHKSDVQVYGTKKFGHDWANDILKRILRGKEQYDLR